MLHHNDTLTLLLSVCARRRVLGTPWAAGTTGTAGSGNAAGAVWLLGIVVGALPGLLNRSSIFSSLYSSCMCFCRAVHGVHGVGWCQESNIQKSNMRSTRSEARTMMLICCTLVKTRQASNQPKLTWPGTGSGALVPGSGCMRRTGKKCNKGSRQQWKDASCLRVYTNTRHGRQQ